MSFWENSWDIFWRFFAASVFFAYLFGVFAIIGDLFRDQFERIKSRVLV
ncbi:hypothetical protein [Arthrobacter humicola]